MNAHYARGFVRSSIVSAIALIGAVSSAAGQMFPGLGDDTTTSLGQFRILVSPQFQPIVTGAPGYDSVSKRFTSPILFDPGTKIGRSAPIVDASSADTTGAPTGTASIPVKDSDMALVPYEAASTVREVHTQIVTFNLTNGAGMNVRAGAAAADRPPSFGEVESLDTTGTPANDFPAKSFFDIFVDVDVPGLGTMRNTTPLLVEGTGLLNFPPTVIYVHGNSTAVPIYMSTPGPAWSAGDLFGSLVLAGHGVGYTNSTADVLKFQTFMSQQPEIPLPEPTGLVLAGLGIVGMAVYAAWRRGKLKRSLSRV